VWYDMTGMQPASPIYFTGQKKTLAFCKKITQNVTDLRKICDTFCMLIQSRFSEIEFSGYHA
jgi:hypothetical protein